MKRSRRDFGSILFTTVSSARRTLPGTKWVLGTYADCEEVGGERRLFLCTSPVLHLVQSTGVWCLWNEQNESWILNTSISMF